MRTAFFIDGYNLFYGLLAGTPYKWLDLPALLTYITKIQDPASETAQVNYFTSLVLPPLETRDKESAEAEDVYIRALKAKGVTVYLGRHRFNRGSAPRYGSVRNARPRLSTGWSLMEGNLLWPAQRTVMK
ncbi:hypothetical protein [Enterobacter sp.]|uniref:hypothetical protein n=1 Tax=Enterobacter sp. TaxID=42895 RepID=UPI00296F2F9A|nr:hypothetical protein [Enterobacter sp.]